MEVHWRNEVSAGRYCGQSLNIEMWCVHFHLSLMTRCSSFVFLCTTNIGHLMKYFKHNEVIVDSYYVFDVIPFDRIAWCLCVYILSTFSFSKGKPYEISLQRQIAK